MKLPRFRLLVIGCCLLAVSSLSGCATNMRMQRVRLPGEEYRKHLIAPAEIKPPAKSFNPGEKLIYQVSWNGIPVGYATLSIESVEKINGRDAYALVSTVRSNEFLSKIYRIEDTYRSYLDTEKLHPLKFEKDTKEGRHSSHDLVEFDHEKGVAHYASLKSGEKKEVEIPAGVQDMLSCLYYFRVADFKIGDRLPAKVYVREKNYDLTVNVEDYQRVNVRNMGDFYVFRIQPLAAFKGIFISRGKGWILVTTDQRRLPIAARVKVVPFGSITCVLERAEGV